MLEIPRSFGLVDPESELRLLFSGGGQVLLVGRGEDLVDIPGHGGERDKFLVCKHISNLIPGLGEN